MMIFLFVAATTGMVACKDEASDAELVIGTTSGGRDMMSYEKTNDVWMYPENYEGRQITIKGLYSVGELSGGGKEKHNFVGVYDGCCTWAYLSFVYDGELPGVNTIVTVKGIVHAKKLDTGSKIVSYAEVEATEVEF